MLWVVGQHSHMQGSTIWPWFISTMAVWVHTWHWKKAPCISEIILITMPPWGKNSNTLMCVMSWSMSSGFRFLILLVFNTLSGPTWIWCSKTEVRFTVTKDFIDSHVMSWDNVLWVANELCVETFVKWFYMFSLHFKITSPIILIFPSSCMYRGSMISMATHSSSLVNKMLKESLKFVFACCHIYICSIIHKFLASLATVSSVASPNCKSTYRSFCTDPRSGLCLVGVPLTPLLGVPSIKSWRAICHWWTDIKIKRNSWRTPPVESCKIICPVWQGSAGRLQASSVLAAALL